MYFGYLLVALLAIHLVFAQNLRVMLIVRGVAESLKKRASVGF